jgi:hypothetical protein
MSPGSASPQARDPVSIENPLVGDEHAVLQDRLRDQHPIERIAMEARQGARTLTVSDRNRQRSEALSVDATGDVDGDIARPREFAQPVFRRDFPSRRCALTRTSPCSFAM